MQDQLIKSERMATIGKLASGVGHELRNPLASIKNVAYYLNRYLHVEDKKLLWFLNMLSSEVDRADKIISDLLEYSRDKVLERSEVSAAELMVSALKKCPAPENVKVRKDEFDGGKVSVDRAKIELAFVKILQNAFQV